MKSSELAHLAGVSVRTLRHYHAIGLLPEPPRRGNGYRAYDATHLLRLLRIRQLASLGFSLDQIGPMLNDLDAERAEGEELGAESAKLLDDLDRQLQRQITQLEQQRELLRGIRDSRAVPDYPARASSALEAISAFERQTHGYGFLLSALTGDDKIAMGVAAHLYSDEELAEIERIFRAIPERGLTQEYLDVSRLMDSLPEGATSAERDAAVAAGLDFLDKIEDCFDPCNWLRPDKDYELMLESMASARYNAAQLKASDELFLRFTKRLSERAQRMRIVPSRGRRVPS